MERVPTGIPGLDPLIEGGLPRRSLVLVAGAPGTGKTSMCCKFLEKGASVYDEKGLYVSFLESEDTLKSYLLHQFGPEFSDLVKRGLIQILALPSMKREGVEAVMESIMATIKDMGAKRLVIDSVTALYQSFSNELESRIFTHTVLTKIIPLYGPTTLIVKEMHPRAQIGESTEDFVADGVIQLRTLIHAGRTLRELRLVKLRGTKIETPTAPFTLEGGFAVFPSSRHKAFDQIRTLERVPNSDAYFSSGSKSLDTILGGGYPKGTMVLLEVGEAVPLNAYGVLSYPIVTNFLKNNSPLVGIQSLGIDPRGTYERWKAFAGENAAYGRSVERKRDPAAEEKPYLLFLKSEKPEDRVTEYLQIGDRLRKETGKPVIWWVALDHFVDIFGHEYAEKALSELSVNVVRHRELAVLLAKPGLEQIMRTVSNIAATHIRVFDRYGSVLFYGVKPRTPFYTVTADAEKGSDSLKFIPIV